MNVGANAVLPHQPTDPARTFLIHTMQAGLLLPSQQDFFLLPGLGKAEKEAEALIVCSSSYLPPPHPAKEATPEHPLHNPQPWADLEIRDVHTKLLDEALLHQLNIRLGGIPMLNGGKWPGLKVILLWC